MVNAVIESDSVVLKYMYRWWAGTVSVVDRPGSLRCVDVERGIYRHRTVNRGEESMLTSLDPFPVWMLNEVYIGTGR